MSLYKTHARLNILLIFPVLLGLVIYLIKFNFNCFFSFSLAFIYGSLFLGPNLDIIDRTKILSWKGVCTLPFRPYAKIFRRRGISHSILMGTATRILYLAALGVLACYLINLSFLSSENIKEFFLLYKYLLIWMFCGFCLADLFHVLIDRLTPKRST